MARLIWFVGLVVTAVWTLLTIGGYALLSVAGDWLIRGVESAPADPDVGNWLAWILGFVQDFGLVMLVLLWLAVSVAILVASAILSRVFGGRNNLI